MRITFLVANYAPSVGGAQMHVRRVAEGLASRHGYEVEVLTTDAIHPPAGRHPGRIELREERMGRVLVRRRPVARRTHAALRGMRRAGRRLGVIRAIRPTPLAVGPLGAQLARSAWEAGRRSDAVVGVGAPFLTLFAADRSTRRASAAYLAMPLLHLGAESLRPWALRSLRRADGCTSSTEYERSWLVANGVAADRISVLPPGCDPERFPDVDPVAARRHLGLAERPTVGYIGRLAAHKGIDTLYDAARRVWETRPDTTLLIAGGVAGWDGFEPLTDRLRDHADDRLVIRRDFEEGDRAMLLSACDVVAFPSREESFGMVTLEGWCARRPVVVADIPPVRSLVRNGVDAELVPVGDDAALARVIAELLADPDRRTSLAVEGRRRAEVEFAWDRIVDRWDGFVRESVGRRRASTSIPRSPRKVS